MQEIQARDRLTRNVDARITAMRQQAEANGGLKRIEIGKVDISVGTDGDRSIVGGLRINARPLVSTVEVTLVYNNDKTARGHLTFSGNDLIFHQGRWKLKYVTTFLN